MSSRFSGFYTGAGYPILTAGLGRSTMNSKMDKEAQGIFKILKAYSLELDDSAQHLIENDDYFMELSKRISFAGYRKRPEGEPPLLSDAEIRQVLDECGKGGSGEPIGRSIIDDFRDVAQAQYNSIMEHLGLPFRV